MMTFIFFSYFSTSSHINFFHAHQIRAEAAYLYDAVHLYTNALIKVLETGGNPKNGTAIINAVKGSSYLSAMGLVFFFIRLHTKSIHLYYTFMYVLFFFLISL